MSFALEEIILNSCLNIVSFSLFCGWLGGSPALLLGSLGSCSHTTAERAGWGKMGMLACVAVGAGCEPAPWFSSSQPLIFH